MRELEALLHRVLRPKGNRQIGRLQGSEDLRRPLQQEMKAIHKQQIAELMGERVRATPTARRATTKARGTTDPESRPLAGWVDRATPLRAWYKGTEYRATLRKNGSVRFAGLLYDSPSGAAKAIRKRPTNGWWLWHMQEANGDWARLRDLRD